MLSTGSWSAVGQLLRRPNLTTTLAGFRALTSHVSQKQSSHGGRRCGPAPLESRLVLRIFATVARVPPQAVPHARESGGPAWATKHGQPGQVLLLRRILLQAGQRRPDTIQAHRRQGTGPGRSTSTSLRGVCELSRYVCAGRSPAPAYRRRAPTSSLRRWRAGGSHLEYC